MLAECLLFLVEKISNSSKKENVRGIGLRLIRHIEPELFLSTKVAWNVDSFVSSRLFSPLLVSFTQSPDVGRSF